ncbi:MAG: WD40/YVTN/BNR-like repeat-containing protein [Acidobacteriota bacterium]
MRLILVACLAAFSALCAGAAERWRVEYFYDPPDLSEFAITALEFPSAERGMAAGTVAVPGRKEKPYAVATSDGGKTWAPVRLPEVPGSLFFLNEKTGWMTGRDNVWRTDDFGATWKKLARINGVLQVYFLDEKHGWAIGAKKTVQETNDGGATWTAVGAAAEPKTSADNTVYSAIAFATPKAGIIAGSSRPPRRGDNSEFPDWMDPETGRREWPGLVITLETRDAGAHWRSSTTSMFGQITALSLAADGRGLGLIEFFDKFDYPSEVYSFDLRNGKGGRVFRRKDRAVTDVLVISEGPAYLAAIEPPGTVFHSPVPGKLKLFRSGDFAEWEEMEVDYRAVGRRATLACPGKGPVWVATDTGMILKLASE